jgi:hypothetical protein
MRGELEASRYSNTPVLYTVSGVGHLVNAILHLYLSNLRIMEHMLLIYISEYLWVTRCIWHEDESHARRGGRDMSFWILYTKCDGM